MFYKGLIIRDYGYVSRNTEFGRNERLPVNEKYYSSEEFINFK